MTTDIAILPVGMSAGEAIEPRLGLHAAGVVMTRYLDQHILERHNGRLGTAESGPARAAR